MISNYLFCFLNTKIYVLFLKLKITKFFNIKIQIKPVKHLIEQDYFNLKKKSIVFFFTIINLNQKLILNYIFYNFYVLFNHYIFFKLFFCIFDITHDKLLIIFVNKINLFLIFHRQFRHYV